LTGPEQFEQYIGIDWSGAKGPKLPGLQIAVAEPGDKPPRLVRPPEGKWWTRPMVDHWLRDRIRARRVLVGFDFAFAYAHADLGGYFPETGPDIDDARSLWSLVEEVCRDVPELYGAPFYYRADLPFHRHFLSPKGRGDLFTSRSRVTEAACADITWPHPVMKCIGAANVGTGSLAGMRLLHHLKRDMDNHVAVWPFEVMDGRSTLVEIFPRLYFKRAGVDPRAWRDPAALNRALAYYGSRALPRSWKPSREDEPDALISAAALRDLSSKPEIWSAPLAISAASTAEGWIFGVDWSS
jgi:hypothetical protein